MDENYVDGPNGRNPARGGMIGVRGFGRPATLAVKPDEQSDLTQRRKEYMQKIQ